MSLALTEGWPDSPFSGPFGTPLRPTATVEYRLTCRSEEPHQIELWVRRMNESAYAVVFRPDDPLGFRPGVAQVWVAAVTNPIPFWAWIEIDYTRVTEPRLIETVGAVEHYSDDVHWPPEPSPKARRGKGRHRR